MSSMRPLSARNPRIARLSRLVRRKEERVEQRALVVEGPVLLVTAIEAGAEVVDVYVDEAQASSPAVTAALEMLPASVEPWLVPPGVLDRIGDVVASQGVLAVVAHPTATWPSPATAPFVVVLAGLQIPGNVGTLVRAAVAAGADAVITVGGADPTGPKVVRSSAGAVFQVPVVVAPSEADAGTTTPDPANTIARLQAAGYRVAAAVVDGGEPHHLADLGEPVALVLGSEAHGLPAEAVAAADLAVTIAMAGPTESLNVAMAGTLLCFEVARRRH